jgi:hypothetical protein
MYYYIVTLAIVYFNYKIEERILVKWRLWGGYYGHGKLGAGGSGKCPAAGR